MRFKKIQFENYRCFPSGDVEFNETNERNINLVIAPNGGGKTEMLFAFWWVLYGFDFKRLLGKEDTPYALNSELYRELQISPIKKNDKCSVTLEFEDNDIVYRLKRWCDYRKTDKNILSDEYQELSHYNENYELSLPIRDEDKIQEKLNRIIPKKILHGIVFDGERMKQLSSVDENATTAIEGMIQNITNVELLEKCIINYESLRKDNIKEVKAIAKKNKLSSLEEVTTKLQDDLKKQKDKETRLSKDEQELENVIKELEEISFKLQKYQESKEYENQRKTIRQLLDAEENRNKEYLNNFTESLKGGYLLTSSKLFDDVRSIVEKYDIPMGLTVEAVKSILKRDKCICGHDLKEEEIIEINNLIDRLPPHNINSTLCEMVRQAETKVNDVKKGIKKDYDMLKESDRIIEDFKQQMASISTRILDQGSEEAKILEQDNERLKQRKWKLEEQINSLKNELEILMEEIENLNKEKATLSENQQITRALDLEGIYINKCIETLKKIKDYNKAIALSKINEKFEKAYLELSEDSELGRRVYIIQYDESSKYQLVTYYEGNYNETYKRFTDNGVIDSLINAGKTNDQIKEYVICSCKESKSTGQSKVVTLAFVKAILDYSNDTRDSDLIEITKKYPLLIDAPFTDIFDKNLVKSATKLPAFSEQIILMLSEDSYDQVKPYLSQKVNVVYKFKKSENVSKSIIEKEDSYVGLY